jgi:protein-disulfide isomerase
MSDETTSQPQVQTTPATVPTSANPYLIPASIVLAGAFIAVALFFNSGGGMQKGGAPQAGEPEPQVDIAKEIRPIDPARDHLKGDPKATVTIVEYSDFQCPFCGTVHPTLEQAVTEYAGKVNWVYRHFPLSSIHPEAEPAARASECVAELGGSAAFWNYADLLFQNQRSLGKTTYVTLATSLGINAAAFTQCFDSGRHADRVAEDLQNALDTGGTGTPHGVVLTQKGTAYPIKGAVPYATIKSIIDTALKD